MNINLAMLAAGRAHHGGVASDLLIRQMIDLQMDAEKRLNHNRYEMERHCYQSPGHNKKNNKIAFSAKVFSRFTIPRRQKKSR